jgi:hypothetical protein
VKWLGDSRNTKSKKKLRTKKLNQVMVPTISVLITGFDNSPDQNFRLLQGSRPQSNYVYIGAVLDDKSHGCCIYFRSKSSKHLIHYV